MTDMNHHRIQVITPSGDFGKEWGVAGSAPREFYYPRGLIIDNFGSLYVADSQNCRIQKYTY